MKQLEIDFLWEHPVYKEYGCDEKGNPYSFRFGKIKKRKTVKKKDGYVDFQISEDGKTITYKVHRFVWECIKGEIPEGYDVDHRNFVRDDNRIDNLRAIPASENRARYSKKGRMIKAETTAKFNKQTKSKQVLQFDRQGNFIAEYPSAREAARQLGIAQSHISDVCNNKPNHKTYHGFIWKYKEVA